jgi:hypothetical protein
MDYINFVIRTNNEVVSFGEEKNYKALLCHTWLVLGLVHLGRIRTT